MEWDLLCFGAVEGYKSKEHYAVMLTALGLFILCSQNEVLDNLRAESFQVHISDTHNFGNSPHHHRENATFSYLQTVRSAT